MPAGHHHITDKGMGMDMEGAGLGMRVIYPTPDDRVDAKHGFEMRVSIPLVYVALKDVRFEVHAPAGMLDYSFYLLDQVINAMNE